MSFRFRDSEGVHTKAEHDVEEYDQDDGDGVHEVAQGAHPEWPPRHIPPACEKMWADCQGIRNGCEDDKRSH